MDGCEIHFAPPMKLWNDMIPCKFQQTMVSHGVLGGTEMDFATIPSMAPWARCRAGLTRRTATAATAALRVASGRARRGFAGRPDGRVLRNLGSCQVCHHFPPPTQTPSLHPNSNNLNFTSHDFGGALPKNSFELESRH